MANTERSAISLFLNNRLAALNIIKGHETEDSERHVQNVQLAMDMSMRAAELRARGDSANADKMQKIADGYKKL